MIRGIILAGGPGSRLWPLSRNNRPKQLLTLGTQKSLIEESVSRLAPVVNTISVSTSKELSEPIKKALPAVHQIVEPSRRDTAAAIGLCAIQYAAEDILVFTPSDAYISPAKEFQETIKKAIALCKGGIVIVAVPPTKPATGYGYIAPGENSRVLAFKEKPDAATAEEYIKKGFLWNAGICVCRAGTLLTLFETHAPELYAGLMKIKQGGSTNAIYPNLQKISFDVAILEKAKDVFYVPAEFVWNDIGSFASLPEIIKGTNTVLNGKVIAVNSSGNVVHSEKTVALLDCDDLIVVDTKDALLVCKKSSAEKIKKLLEEHVPKELQ